MAGGHTLTGHLHPFKICATHDAAALGEVGRLNRFLQGEPAASILMPASPRDTGLVVGPVS